MRINSPITYLLLFLLCSSLSEGNEKRIVAADLKTLDGRTVNSLSLLNDSTPMVLVFWLSFHKNPVKELDAIAEHYNDWQKETGVRVVAVAIDDTRTSWKVGAIVNEHEWEYEVYLDPTQDFKRGMNVNDVPHTLVVNERGVVTWEKVGYTEGDEEIIHREIIKTTQ